MPIRRLKGPHLLQALEIGTLVSTSGPAVYALGSQNDDGEIVVLRVGVTAIDLQTHLEQYIGRYSHFKFYLCPSIDEAFALACELYHAYMPKDNFGHPSIDSKQMTECPHCGFKRSEHKASTSSES